MRFSSLLNFLAFKFQLLCFDFREICLLLLASLDIKFFMLFDVISRAMAQPRKATW